MRRDHLSSRASQPPESTDFILDGSLFPKRFPCTELKSVSLLTQKMSQLAPGLPDSAAQARYHTAPGIPFTWAPMAETGGWPGVCKATALVCHQELCVLTLNVEVCLQVEMFSAE